jgi:PAS domain S-box-containing protein
VFRGMDTTYRHQITALLEHIADGVYILDSEWRVTYWNDKAKHTTSRTDHDVLGRTFWEVFPGARGTIFEERFRTALETGEPQHFHARGVTTGRWMQMHYHPFDGGLAIAFRDLTKEERANAELRALYESAPVGLCFLDAQLRYISVNEQLARWNGFPVEAHLGRTIRELLPGAADLIEPLLLKVIETATPVVDWEVEIPHLDASEQRFWRGSFHPVKDPDGSVIGVNGVIQNITQRKQQEAALHRSEERFRTLADTIPNLVWLTGPDGASLGENRPFRDYFGLAQQAGEATGWLEWIHPEEYVAVMDRWQYSLQTGRHYEKELRLRRYDGVYRWHLARALPVRNVYGEVEFWCGTATDIHDFKVTEEALRSSEERYRMLADNIQDVFYVADPHVPAVLYVSPAFEDVWGRSCQSLYDDVRVLHESVFPEDRPLLVAALRTQAKGEATQVEYRILRPDGTLRWVWDQAFPVADAEGHVFRVTGIAEDITDRKLAEESFRESEQRFHAIFDRATAGIVLIRPDGTYLDANPAFCGMLGRNREELIGTSLERDVAPGTERQLEEIREAFRQSGEWHGEFPLLTAAGAQIELEWWISRFSMPGVTLAVVNDVTQRNEASRKIHFQASLLNAVEQSVIATDKEGRIISWNRFAESLYGWRAEEVVGRYVSEVTPSKTSQPVAAAIMKRLKSGESWSGEFEVQRRDGTTFPAYVIDSPILDEDGKIMGIVGVSIDMTLRKNAEEAMRVAKEAAEAANEAKTVFLANMSHEIRTPLTAMIGFASLLSRQLEGKPRTYAQRIEDGGKRLTETLSAILTLARLETGRVEIDLEELVVSDEVREIATMIQPQAERKGLRFEVSVASRAAQARMRVDRGAFTSILQNLVSNAVKFTEKGGVTITVDVDEPSSAARPGSQVHIHVVDTGIGIDTSFMAHIFEPFKQESSGLSRSHEGSGLGLSIAHQLAEKMHGRVTVVSEKGHGSRFTVSFPLVTEPDRPAAKEPHRKLPGNGTRPRMLVVEDNEDTSLLIETLLEDRCEVVLARNGLEALEAVRAAAESDRFDAMLLDVNLESSHDGTSLLRQILAMPPYRSIPVAALTAHALPGDRERFLSQGFTAYLSKPFMPRDLHGLVSSLLNGRLSG